MNDIDIAKICKIKHTIIDKQIKIGPGNVIGYDLEANRQHYVCLTQRLGVILKGSTFN